jgi:purine-nucleoside phosphorylase
VTSEGTTTWQDLEQARAFLEQRGVLGDVGIVLGSGLGYFADTLLAGSSVPYAEIPRMPTVGVVGHGGRLYSGTLGRARVLCLQGRVHLYEGWPLDRVVFGVRLLARLGVKAILLTNAAGGISSAFVPGDLMLIRDHINFTGKNPLVGSNDERNGPRFVDLTQAYDARLCEAAARGALDVGVELKEGVYAAMLGPSYETPAEIRMLKTLGVDAVGMSTVPEVIASNHLGVPVAAMSCITNIAAGLGTGKLSHAEVEQTARVASERFQKVLGRWVERVAELHHD